MGKQHEKCFQNTKKRDISLEFARFSRLISKLKHDMYILSFEKCSETFRSLYMKKARKSVRSRRAIYF